MKILLSAYEPPENFALRDNKEKFDTYIGEWYVYSEEMRKAGISIDGAALETPQTATVVSVRNGVRHVEDGPFPDAKEQLGGFFIIDAPDLASAADWAAKCPAAQTGYVDARVIPSLEDHAQ